MSNTWDRTERRDCDKCKELDVLDHKVNKCKSDFEIEFDQVHCAVSDLKGEVHGLRADVHRMTESVSSINVSLETIAATLTKLTDFPETWNKIQGFWSVMRWFKDNVLLLALIVAVLLYSVKTLGFAP
jgi:hypothetical protein